MNEGNRISKMWCLAVLCIVSLAGCGGGGSGDSGGGTPASAKAMTSYSVAGAAGTINESAKTIAVTVPNGTSVTAQAATFAASGSSVKVGAALQTSGTTVNSFAVPVAYTVTAVDGTTATYTVTVTVASASAKEITTFSLNGVAGSINETAKTISVTLPSGTNVTALVAAFRKTGASVTVGAVVQASGITANNFTTPVSYVVTAADSTTAAYTVTVQVASNTAKAITAYVLAGVAGTLDETARTISVTMPNGTDRTALVATFTTTGTSVKVGSTVQASAITANNFTSPVTYTVTAADNSTVTYAVTVIVAASAGPAPVALGTAGNYVILANTGINTAANPSVIIGNMAAGPGVTSTAITGFSLSLPAASAFSTSAQVTGKIYAFDYAVPTPTEVNTASNDMGTAYTDAAGRTATSAATTNVGSGTLTSLTLAPGVYKWGGAVTIPTDLTLNGTATDVWILKVAGTLDMAAAKKVILTGGALPQNVFWQVSGAVSVGAGTEFKGIVLGQTAITFGNNASIRGRLLAQTAVTLDATAVTKP